MKLIDLTGRKFGRLTVLCRVPSVNKRTKWKCVCECGNEIEVESYNLKTGHTNSCGCWQKEATSTANRTHGQRKTRLYRIWVCMRNRCYQKNYHAFQHYGGRGITVCDEWNNSFETFRDWAMSHGYTDNLTIDRKDNDKGYSPENCKWSTMAEQNQNKRAPNGRKIKELA